jgi:hypothetical protein
MEPSDYHNVYISKVLHFMWHVGPIERWTRKGSAVDIGGLIAGAVQTLTCIHGWVGGGNIFKTWVISTLILRVNYSMALVYLYIYRHLTMWQKSSLDFRFLLYLVLSGNYFTGPFIFVSINTISHLCPSLLHPSTFMIWRQPLWGYFRPVSFVHYSFLYMAFPKYFFGPEEMFVSFTFQWRWLVNEWPLCSGCEDGCFRVVLFIPVQQLILPPLSMQISSDTGSLIKTSLKASGAWYQSTEDKQFIIKWLTPSFCSCCKHSSIYVLYILHRRLLR